MNKPRKPRKPSGPRQVSQTFPKPKKRIESDSIRILHYGSDTIQEVLDRAIKSSAHKKSLKFHAEIGLSDIQVGYDVLKVNVKCSWDNPQYDLEMRQFEYNCQQHEAKYAKYLEDLKKFDAKMEKYGKSIKIYQRDLETWQELEDAKELAKKEAQYEKLAKELGKS